MATVIHKYRLVEVGDAGKYTVNMPCGSKILHLGLQGDVLYIWAQCNPENETVVKKFVVVGTGQTVNPNWTYLKTIFDGPFVWHIFKE